MDFTYNREQESFRQEITGFCREQADMDNRNSATDPIEFHRKVAEKGWFGLSIPIEYGGLGLDAIHRVIFNEEMAYHRAPISLGLYGRSFMVFGQICLKHGTEQQKNRWLPRLVRGEAIGQCYTEPEAGTDLSRIQTRAVRENGHYVINGQKMFITTTHILKHTLLMAITDATVAPAKGISMFVMDNTSPGVTISPMQGLGSYRTNQIFLDNVKIPVENLIGEENHGMEYYIKNKPFYLHKEQGAIVGGMRRNFEDLVDYVKGTRKAGSLLSDNPLIRQKLARMATDIRSMRWLTYRLAWMDSQGMDIHDIASITRVHDVESWLKFNNDAMQILGTSGQLKPGSDFTPLNGMMQWHYQYDAIQYFTRGSPSYTKSMIATHGLGMPEL